MDAGVRSAARRRDLALARVRLLTALTVLVGFVLTGALAALAAGSTHARTVVKHVARVRRREAPVTAPAPPLVAVAAPSAAAAPAAEPAPAPAPVAAPSAPVVVSGGS